MELVVVGHEGLGRRAAVNRLQDRRLDLQEALRVQIGAQRAHDGRPGAKDVAYWRVRQQIDVTPPEARLLVAHAVPLVGHGLQRLAQKLDGAGLHAELARLGDEEAAGRAHEVAEVHQPLPDLIVVGVGETVLARHDLDRAGAVFQIGEAHLAHDTQSFDAPGDRHHGIGPVIARSRSGPARVKGAGLGNGVAAVDTSRIRLDAQFLEARQVAQTGNFLVSQNGRVEQRVIRFVHWEILRAVAPGAGCAGR